MEKSKCIQNDAIDRFAHETIAPFDYNYISWVLRKKNGGFNPIELIDGRIYLTAMELTESINFSFLPCLYNFELDRYPEYKAEVSAEDYNLNWEEAEANATIDCWYCGTTKSNCYIIEYDWKNAEAYCVSEDDYCKCFNMYVELNKETKAEFNAEDFLNLTKQNAEVFKTSINDIYNPDRLYHALGLDKEEYEE